MARCVRDGERVVVFLQLALPDWELAVEGPFWLPVDQHYTVAAADMATDGYRTVPLQQLLDEIAAALRQ